MHKGKVFELKLIEVLCKIYGWLVVTDDFLDRKEKIDFTVFGWRGELLPVPVDFQVTMQVTNGSKMQVFMRRAWYDANSHIKVYMTYDTPAEVLAVAQAIHHTLMCDLTGFWVKPDDKFGLHIGANGTSSFFNLGIQATIMKQLTRALSSTSNRKRGIVTAVQRRSFMIKAGDREYIASFADVVGNSHCNVFTSRNRIRSGTFVTFIPQEAKNGRYGIADVIRIAKQTAKRHQRQQASV